MSGVSFDSFLPCPPIPKRETPESWLRELTTRGISWRYGTSESAEVTGRLERELEMITAARAASYMLIVAEYVDWAKQERILVCPGRGTVAGSVVAYALGITEVDPLRHGLLFERFLNAEVSTFPDIDLDFEWGRRTEVIEHIVSIYGKDAVAGITVGDDPERVHAAGVLVADRPVFEVTPVQILPRTAHTGWLKAVEYRTGIDYIACERLGLVKFDLLSLKALRSTKRTVEAVARNGGATIAPWSSDIPLDDPSTFEILRAGDTDGVFQLGHSWIQEYLRELQPERFDHLAALMALYRPRATARGILNAYIDRKHGRVPTWAVHPELDGALAPILDETYGLLAYQEQMMMVVHTLAGMSLGEADRLRRTLLRNVPSSVETGMSKFRAAVEGRGYSKDAAEAVGQLLLASSGYAFQKSHAVSYALITYSAAYLKAHYPVEFDEGIKAE